MLGINLIGLPSPGGTSVGQFQMDAAAERFAFVLYAPKTGTLDSIQFMAGTVVSSPSIKVSFQDIDANGDPDGVVDQYAIFVPSGSAWNDVGAGGYMGSGGAGSGTKRSVTRGDRFAVVFEIDSYAAGNRLDTKYTQWTSQYFPPCRLKSSSDSGSTWFDTNGYVPIVAVKYDDGSYDYMPSALIYKLFTSWTAVSSFNTSNPTEDEVALKFQLPVPIVVDWLFAGLTSTNAGDFDLVVYDSDGTTVLASVSFDASAQMANQNTNYGRLLSASLALQANKTYYVAVKPTTTTNVTLLYVSVESADLIPQAIPFTATYAYRVDGGSWSEDTGKLPVISFSASPSEAAPSTQGLGGGSFQISQLTQMVGY